MATVTYPIGEEDLYEITRVLEASGFIPSEIGEKTRYDMNHTGIIISDKDITLIVGDSFNLAEEAAKVNETLGFDLEMLSQSQTKRKNGVEL